MGFLKGTQHKKAGLNPGLSDTKNTPGIAFENLRCAVCSGF